MPSTIPSSISAPIHLRGFASAALAPARAADRTYVIAWDTDPSSLTEGGIYWQVGVPEVSSRAEVVAAHDSIVAGKSEQRRA